MGKPKAGVASPAGGPLQRRDLNAGHSRDAKLKPHAAGINKRSGATPPVPVSKQLATPRTAPAASERPGSAAQPKTHQRRKSSSALAAAGPPSSAKPRRLASPSSRGRSPRTPRARQDAAAAAAAGGSKAGKAPAPLAAVQSPSTGRRRSAAQQHGE